MHLKHLVTFGESMSAHLSLAFPTHLYGVWKITVILPRCPTGVEPLTVKQRNRGEEIVQVEVVLRPLTGVMEIRMTGNWSGRDCSTFICDTSETPCLNGGTCFPDCPNNTDYVCSCPFPYVSGNTLMKVSVDISREHQTDRQTQVEKPSLYMSGIKLWGC